MHTTTIVLQSKHSPDDSEIESVLDSLIAAAELQGFAPLRAQAIYDTHVSDTPTKPAHYAIKSSRVVNDGVMQGQWES